MSKCILVVFVRIGWRPNIVMIRKIGQSHSYVLLLGSLDMAVLDKLHGLDDGILNPAIAKIVETLLGAKDGAEGFVGPILESVLKPLGLLKDKPESESTLKPNGSTAM